MGFDGIRCCEHCKMNTLIIETSENDKSKRKGIISFVKTRRKGKRKKFVSFAKTRRRNNLPCSMQLGPILVGAK